MNRRDMILGTGLALAATTLARADKPKTAATPSSAGLTTVASHCIGVAQACLRHCLAMLASGNVSMAGCGRTVADFIPAAEALTAIAPGGSRHVAPLAKLVAEIAKDCKVECDKHAAMEPCKACSDSCAALIAEIAKI